ncbi:helix-turn-helix transcriptional regulator [Roseovarius mucosus]|uniref:helix-turn-helix transcriptional regulator n=1 Tax=Roseovarius mucosus TaxID=215743 RepID=UPI003BAB2B56
MEARTEIGIAHEDRAADLDRQNNSHCRIRAAVVRQMCGDISDMTLWRWLENPELNFPRPIYIGRRRYWREADIVAWLEAREVSE